jgi:hypothetical protein
MIMKYYYWIALAILVFLICYTVANKDMIVMEHLTSATAGPMNSGKKPAPASAPAAPAMSKEDEDKCMVSLIDSMFSLGAIPLPAKCSSMKADFDTKIKEQVDGLPDNERNICTTQLLEPMVKEAAAKYSSGTDVSGDIARCLKVLYVKNLSPGGGGGGGGGGGDVAALTSKLTALQKEVDDMKKESKDQMAQASAAQAGLQAIN